MTELADHPAQSVRTWRPMVLWTVGILMALGLAWFVGVIVVPMWQVRSTVLYFIPDYGMSHGKFDCSPYVDRLGGAEAALPKIRLYCKMPEFVAPYKPAAARMLGGCGRRAVPDLVRMLRSPEPYIRQVACEALADIGADAEQAMPALLGLLREGAPDMREYVCHAIAEIGPGAEGAVPLLIPMLRGGDQCLAARTLGMIGPKAAAAVPDLVPLLQNQDWMVVHDAVEALIKIGDPRMLEPLLKVLDRKQEPADAVLRHRVAGALGDFRDPRVVRPLLSALDDHSLSDPAQLKYAGPGARESIEKLFAPGLAALALKGRFDFETSDLPSVEQLRAPLVFELLLALLESGRPGSCYAALLLGASGDRRALEPLLTALRDKAQLNRSEMAYALGSLADPRAVAPLAACLSDKDKYLRKAAAWALGEIGPRAAAAIPALQEALKDGEETVRDAAAEALEKIRGGEPGK